MEIHDYNTRRAGREEGRKEGREEGRQEGRQEGHKEGREEGREEGISALVTTLQEFNVEKSAAVQKIMMQFHLLPQVAEEKVERYWKK